MSALFSETGFAAAEANIGLVWQDPANLGPPVSDQMTPGRVAEAKKALQEAQRKVALASRAAISSGENATGSVAGIVVGFGAGAGAREAVSMLPRLASELEEAVVELTFPVPV